MMFLEDTVKYEQDRIREFNEDSIIIATGDQTEYNWLSGYFPANQVSILNSMFDTVDTTTSLEVTIAYQGAIKCYLNAVASNDVYITVQTIAYWNKVK